MDFTTDWPHQWYGIWSMGFPSRAQFPRVQDAIDLEWSPDDKEELINYLDGCDVVAVFGSDAPCELCPAELPQGHHSDGTWLWGITLTHYVREHGVVIPDRMAEHIRQQNYVPRPWNDHNLEDLPWPDSFAMKRRKREGGNATIDGIKLSVGPPVPRKEGT